MSGTPARAVGCGATCFCGWLEAAESDRDQVVEQLRLVERQCRVVSVSGTHGALDAADGSDGADSPYEEIGAPAPRPCLSCPYRRDVPSGIWHTEEYEKLRRYDRETGLQPDRVFQCHQVDADSDRHRMCAGWVACHGEELLSLRLALLSGRISDATFEAAVTYRSPVPVFDTGGDAADHGQADIERPSEEAHQAMTKIIGRRSDLHG